MQQRLSPRRPWHSPREYLCRYELFPSAFGVMPETASVFDAPVQTYLCSPSCYSHTVPDT